MSCKSPQLCAHCSIETLPYVAANLAAAQYEHDYLPHRLGNWEVPSSDKLQVCGSLIPWPIPWVIRHVSTPAVSNIVKLQHADRLFQALQYPDNLTSALLQRTTAATRFSTVRPRSGKTSFIVDERGHLLPGAPAGTLPTLQQQHG